MRECEARSEISRGCFFLTDYTEVIVLHMSRNLDVALDFVESVSLFFVKYIEVVVSCNGSVV